MKKIYLLILVVFIYTKPAFAQDRYLGEIRLVAFNGIPNGWARCDGSLLPIAQNQALFALLGTTYGGNGTTTFALPDYRGRAVVGVGANYPQGTKTGSETVTLTISNLPSHSHDEVVKVNTGDATIQIPAASSHLSKNVVQAGSTNLPGLAYNNLATNVNLDCGATSTSGSSTPVNVMQPYLALTYMISTVGIFPSQN
jgi:microcystin-dependent protein